MCFKILSITVSNNKKPALDKINGLEMKIEDLANYKLKSTKNLNDFLKKIYEFNLKVNQYLTLTKDLDENTLNPIHDTIINYIHYCNSAISNLPNPDLKSSAITYLSNSGLNMYIKLENGAGGGT